MIMWECESAWCYQIHSHWAFMVCIRHKDSKLCAKSSNSISSSSSLWRRAAMKSMVMIWSPDAFRSLFLICWENVTTSFWQRNRCSSHRILVSSDLVDSDWPCEFLEKIAAVKHPGMYLPTRELQDKEIPGKQYIMQEYKKYSIIVISMINHVNIPCMDWYLMVFVESLQEKITWTSLSTSPAWLACDFWPPLRWNASRGDFRLEILTHQVDMLHLWYLRKWWKWSLNAFDVTVTRVDWRFLGYFSILWTFG